ncbi:MAG: glycosyltransferase [Pseudomonadota bacterium]|nr:glycosyltransferase [Pseudomonadota bacterium]
MPALQALADLGHEVVYLDRPMELDDYRKVVKRLNFDIAVLYGNSLQNCLMSFSEPFFLDDLQIPYVSLWTDNPLKHLFLLKDLDSDLHKGMFVADTRVIEQLKELGYGNTFYLPPWHIDPEIFSPQPAKESLRCNLSFAATVNSYFAERGKWRMFWDYHMNAAADQIIKTLRQNRSYVDVFDCLGKDFDPQQLPFSLMSHSLYFEQKAIVREQIIDTIAPRKIDITGIGGAKFDADNVTMHPGREWYDLSSTFCSATINLNATPWPRSCHHRVFQICASRALVVSDWRDDSAELFEPDREVIYYRSLDDLPDIIDRFVSYPNEAEAIAEEGHKRFLAHHTVLHRMSDLTNKLYQVL